MPSPRVAIRLDLLTDGPSRKVLEVAVEMADWGADPGAGRARGVAFAIGFGVPVAHIVKIEDTCSGIMVRDVWMAADVGIALDTRNLDAQLISGVNFGLSAAIGEEITVSDGSVVQSNYHDYPLLGLYHAPRIHTKVLETYPHIRGIGEAGTPTTAPPLGNAVNALSGQRLREMPFGKAVRFDEIRYAPGPLGTVGRSYVFRTLAEGLHGLALTV